MIRVIIMQGIPGSGKTNWFKRAKAATYVEADYGSAREVYWEHFSADHFFERLGHFDPSKLGEAHGACLREYVESLLGWRQTKNTHRLAVQDVNTNLVVDNTNTSLVEIAPYVALAQAYAVEVKFVRVHCDPETAFQRQTHGVPLAGIQAMDQRLRELVLPPFWKYKLTEVRG